MLSLTIVAPDTNFIYSGISLIYLAISFFKSEPNLVYSISKSNYY